MLRPVRRRRLRRAGDDAPAARRGHPGASKRYTPPIPREVRRSPKWYPWMLLGLLVVGILVIIANYVSLLPASPSNWYTLGGLVGVLLAALLATYYR